MREKWGYLGIRARSQTSLFWNTPCDWATGLRQSLGRPLPRAGGKINDVFGLAARAKRQVRRLRLVRQAQNIFMAVGRSGTDRILSAVLAAYISTPSTAARVLSHVGGDENCGR